MDARKYIICDIEATGLDSNRDIIEIALITYKDGEILDRYETLVNPLRPISNEISRLTGITNRDLERAPRFDEVASRIKERLSGGIFVSHHTDFDLTLLKTKFKELGENLEIKSYCTLKVAQQEIPGLENYNLDALCSFFRIKNHDRHRAMGDAEAALKLFKELETLRNKVYARPLYLPQHEVILKKVPARAGVLVFLGKQNEIHKKIPARNLLKSAEEMLLVDRKNKTHLEATVEIQYEVTGSTLIAEILDYLETPFTPRFVINSIKNKNGELEFKIFPYKKGKRGHWYFKNFFLAQKKLTFLNQKILDKKFIYQEGGKSKEEVLRHNQKVQHLVKETEFPSPNIAIIGEGRKMGELSIVLIRKDRVRGFGHTDASEAEVYENPDKFITTFLSSDVGIDLIAIEYLRIIKNLKFKTESWRTLAEV